MNCEENVFLTHWKESGSELVGGNGHVVQWERSSSIFLLHLYDYSPPTHTWWLNGSGYVMGQIQS